MTQRQPRVSTGVPKTVTPNVTKGVLIYLLAILGTATLQSFVKSGRAIGFTTDDLLLVRSVGVLIVTTLWAIIYGARHPGTVSNLLRPSFEVKKVAGVEVYTDMQVGKELEGFSRIWRFLRTTAFRDQVIRSFLMLGTSVGVFQSAVYLGVGQISALSLASLPPLVQLTAKFFGKSVHQAVKPWVYAVLAVSFVGVAILMVNAQGKGGGIAELLKGIGWLGLASGSTAFMQHMNGKAADQGEPRYTSLAWQSFASAFVIPFLFRDWDVDRIWTLLHGGSWNVFVFAMVIVMGIVPQFSYIVSAIHAKAVTTVQFAVAQPIFGAALDFFRDGTVPSFWGVVALLVLSSSAILNIKVVRLQAREDARLKEEERQKAQAAPLPPGATAGS